ncbi:MAG: KH domain-containing protein [Candidatus Gracilibacteria bacterium]|nr:KH domain-containing protein [Candidatus Gracilibacteria bacterium]
MELENVKQIVSDFFNKMLIDIESIEILKEDENIFYVKIKTNDSPLVIGYSGKNLEDIRTVLRGILSKINGQSIVIHLEVNDYLSKKEDKLIDFISKKIQIAKTGKEVILPFFNSYERKKIHGFVSSLNDDSIFTKSIGEGAERKLHICKKNKNITIDMDGIDI